MILWMKFLNELGPVATRTEGRAAGTIEYSDFKELRGRSLGSVLGALYSSGKRIFREDGVKPCIFIKKFPCFRCHQRAMAPIRESLLRGASRSRRCGHWVVRVIAVEDGVEARPSPGARRMAAESGTPGARRAGSKPKGLGIGIEWYCLRSSGLGDCALSSTRTIIGQPMCT